MTETSPVTGRSVPGSKNASGTWQADPSFFIEVLRFHPDIVFFQTGVDALAEDTLGRLSLTHEGLRCRDSRVMMACRSNAIPLVAVLGGGYSRPIDATVEAHANTFRTAKRIYEPHPE
jgi:acetoin utilization deacetylase AcuC-like enzyme